jgi:hypothetical protein
MPWTNRRRSPWPFRRIYARRRQTALHLDAGSIRLARLGPPPVRDMLRDVRPQYADRLWPRKPQFRVGGEELPMASQEVEQILLLARPVALPRMGQDADRADAVIDVPVVRPVLSDLGAACRERRWRIGSRARFERTRVSPWTARIANHRRPPSGRGERCKASDASGAESAGGGTTSGPARC